MIKKLPYDSSYKQWVWLESNERNYLNREHKNPNSAPMIESSVNFDLSQIVSCFESCVICNSSQTVPWFKSSINYDSNQSGQNKKITQILHRDLNQVYYLIQ